MLKKEITYKDLDGNPITETFWFHLNEAELARMAIGKEGKHGGFDKWVRTLIASNDGEEIVENFEKILTATIGRRSEDNKSFIKNQEIRDSFVQSDAYSVLFMELLTDEKKMSDFINAVVPSNARQSIAQNMPPTPVSEQGSTNVPPVPVSEQPKDNTPDWLKEGRVPTAEELKGATPEQLQEAFRRREISGSS